MHTIHLLHAETGDIVRHAMIDDADYGKSGRVVSELVDMAKAKQAHFIERFGSHAYGDKAMLHCWYGPHRFHWVRSWYDVDDPYPLMSEVKKHKALHCPRCGWVYDRDKEAAFRERSGGQGLET
jgi:hypothetical protein